MKKTAIKPAKGKPPKASAGFRLPPGIAGRWAPPAALVALTAAVYASSLHGQFIFDDSVIVQPLMIRSHAAAESLWGLLFGWRGLLTFSYGLNFYWGSFDTFGYHAVNV